MTAKGREPGINEDQGQAWTGRSWMSKPGTFGAMTTILDVPSQGWPKRSVLNGLTGDSRTATGKMANQAETILNSSAHQS